MDISRSVLVAEDKVGSFGDWADRRDDDRAKEATAIFGLVSFCQVGILFKVTSVRAVDKGAFGVLSEGEGALDVEDGGLELAFQADLDDVRTQS